MGIYDREYSRGPEPGFHLTAPTSATVQIMLLTGAVYLVQMTVGERFDEIFALKADWFTRPWTCYQLLTYGFLHSTRDIGHILLNMLIFFMFGRELEHRYGRREFVFFYLAAIVFAGLAWSLSEYAYVSSAGARGVAHLIGTVGASGGIAGLVALFALNFPHRQVLLFFVIPMPMWVAAVLGLSYDVMGAIGRTGAVAFTAHLGGALFGLLYYHFKWSLSRFVPSALAWPRAKPRLRVHAPNESDEGEEDQLGDKVDAILQKIQEQGQDSLTWNERRLLEKASRKAREKRK
jgi:membrane associated rhomboid family serine protease